MTDWQTGLRAFREGRMREAADRLSTAAQEQERTVSQGARFQTYAFLGAALYALGQAAEAVPAFEAAIQLSPTAPAPADLHVNLANALLASGHPADARQALSAALSTSPGHVEARMLLDRLDAAHADITPVTGSVLGETPASVRRYMETLSFSSATSGYDPAQVREALSQIEHYLDFISSQLAEKDNALARMDAELSRLQENEDGLIRSLMASQQEAENLRQAASISHAREDAASYSTPGPQERELTPLEMLMRPKT